MAERFRKLPGMDPIMDSALSFAASKDDPASGGRHKVWGSKPLWVLPQTSTIASHLPKALRHRGGDRAGAKRIGHACRFRTTRSRSARSATPVPTMPPRRPRSTRRQWTAYQKLPRAGAVRLRGQRHRHLGEDARRDGSAQHSATRRPRLLLRRRPRHRPKATNRWRARSCIAAARAARPSCTCAPRASWVHAGTDFEIEYRPIEELLRSRPPIRLLRSAAIALESGLIGKDELLAQYEAIRAQVLRRGRGRRPTPEADLAGRGDAPLAPYSPERCGPKRPARRLRGARLAVFGSEKQLPENQPPRIWRSRSTRPCTICSASTRSAAVRRGRGAEGRRLHGHQGPAQGVQVEQRVFNTLLDETIILGLAQGFANLGMLPIPEIQYLAYFHNACDQIRGEACSLQFFSQQPVPQPDGHAHRRPGLPARLRRPFPQRQLDDRAARHPGLMVGCPSRGDDAAMMLRTLMALAQGRRPRLRLPGTDRAVHDQGLVRTGDGQWSFAVPGARPGDANGAEPRLPPGGDGPADRHLRQRRADEPAHRARVEKPDRQEDPRGRPALAAAAERGLHRRARRRVRSASWWSTKAAAAPASAKA
jgi:2-oxoisovalerate dehydrogenase E1 component